MKTKTFVSMLVPFAIAGILAFQSCLSDMSSELKENAEGIESLRTKSSNVQSECYSPIGVIPDWAAEKMSKEELKMWRIVVSVYHVDFSFMRDSMSATARESLNETLILMLEDIKDNKIKEETDYYFSVKKSAKSNLPKRLTMSEQGSAVKIYGPVTLYESNSSYACVLGTFTYTINNTGTSIVSVGGSSVYASPSGASFYGMATASKYGEYSVNFSCAGTLYYYNASENFNVSHVYKIIL